MRSWSGEKGKAEDLNWTMRADWDKWEDSRTRKPHFHCLCFVSFHIPHKGSLADHTTPASPHAGRKRLLKQQPGQEAETLQWNTEMDGETGIVRDENFLFSKYWVQKSFHPVHLHDFGRHRRGFVRKISGQKSESLHIASLTWCFEQRSSAGYAHSAV